MHRLDGLKNRRAILVALDLFACGAIGMLFVLVGGGPSPAAALLALALLTACVILTRAFFRLYNQVWRYATAEEYTVYVLSDFAAGVLYLLASLLLPEESRIGPTQAAAVVAVNCLASLSSRFLYQRLYRRLKQGGAGEAQAARDPDAFKIRVAIVGAGSAGFYLARELQSNSKSRFKPCFFIDNDEQKIGHVVAGLKVCPEEKIGALFEDNQIDDVIIALPGLTGEKRQELYDFYSAFGVRVKIYEQPFMREGTTGSDAMAQYDKAKKPVLRDFRIEDLLFREPVKLNTERTGRYYADKTILITGGGGSIGSEIVRQLAKFAPKKLIVFDCYENNAYDIQQEMKVKYGSTLDLAVEISSVREQRRVYEVMDCYRPDIVIHAAAHKHVPLMEHNCAEAVKNNVFGTQNVADAAERCGVEKFIMVSTDKAVNPTNVMGASKRMCEMIVQSRSDKSAAQSRTQFAAVRFGNVLGSNGSVIPLFKRQIANGGPVTITDRRIIRYFMTIPEAAQLVLEAGSMARDGELYVLDMGKPVKIVKLAEDMIRLSGFTPYKDIAIKEIGLREGEKLYEELLVKTEELDRTDNELIFIERDKGLSRAEVQAKLDALRAAVEDGGAGAVKAAMKAVVPTYHDPQEVNQKASGAREMQAVEESMAG